MPVPVANLDDRRFEDLVREGRALLPLRAPDWTNHNTADPGITILELFAFMTESFLYQANRITEQHQREFLRMLVGLSAEHTIGVSLRQRIEEVVRQFDEGERAITPHDYVRLAEAVDPEVARAHCVAGIDLTAAVPFAQPNHVSVVIIPRSSEERPSPSEQLIQRVTEVLDRKRLLATHVHVVAPRYVAVKIQISVVAEVGTAEGPLCDEIATAVRVLLDPAKGGPTGTGWPVGKALYLAALVKHLEAVPHVAYVEPDSIIFDTNSSRLHRGPDTRVVALELGPGEFIAPELSRDTIRVAYGA